MSAENVRIVLVRPQGPANVGSVARAMKNMGMSDLVLVDPAPLDDGWAEAMAVHAKDLLAGAARVASLPEAIAGCGLSVGTTARSGSYRVESRTPRDIAPELARLAGSTRIALVFGPEDHGLSNDDLKACQRLISIPTSPDYASLNLAQAVLICCYEVALALDQVATATEAPPSPADAERVSFMLDRLQQAFSKIGFLVPENPDHIMHTIRRIFGRAALQPRDVNVLLGLARQIDWFGREGWRQSMPSVEESRALADVHEADS